MNPCKPDNKKCNFAAHILSAIKGVRSETRCHMTSSSETRCHMTSSRFELNIFLVTFSLIWCVLIYLQTLFLNACLFNKKNNLNKSVDHKILKVL